MATGWVKSLHCKSKAFEDVYNPNPNRFNLNSVSGGCRNTIKTLKDVAEKTQKNKPKKKPPSTVSNQNRPNRARLGAARPPARTPDSFFPTLTELPEGHASRNVVEIIFRTSWSPQTFPGSIEMIFKLQNLPKTVARFEEYRETVKSRAGSGGRTGDNVRCVADGNEVMRFHCAGPTARGVFEAGGVCLFPGKDSAIRTFSGSGGAHESVGGGKGRRSMLVCRVIAGRVCKRVDSFVFGCGFDSVSRDKGELLVFDSRAVLPCFLIIYSV